MSNYIAVDHIETLNIAEELDQELLDKIGRTVVEEYLLDETSRQDWLKKNEEWMKLALQITETKNYPWPKASNVKYPLLTTGAVQFAARAYPALVKNPNMVRAKVTGADPTGAHAKSAKHIARHMSWQVLEQMEEWEEDMDKLTIIVPITGCVFKKSYFCPSKKRNVSELVYARDLCINYYATTLETAQRATHILEMYDNDILERKRRGQYLDIPLDYNPDTLVAQAHRMVHDQLYGTTPPADKKENLPKIILEQHRYWDLDDDGYKEPYIVTVDLYTKKVLRIVARFDKEGLEVNDQEEIVKITPVEYFTKFPFIPNPDGSVYDIGFGILLGSLNESVNTIINNLLDAGTLSNMQSGFISRGLRLKGGNKRFKPGEWKYVNATGQDLKNGIFPLPVREPSNVLFLLLGTILESGEKLSSIVDILTGENPGQNQPATTTLAVIEQGLKVYTAIHKRLYKALKREFFKLFRLNSIYLDPAEYYEVLDDPSAPAEVVMRQDYQSGMVNVTPAADPNIATETQQIIKAQAALELVNTGQVNPQVAVRRLLEAMDQPNIDELMQVQPPQPDFDQLIKMGEAKIARDRLEHEKEVMSSTAMANETKAVSNLAKAEKDAGQSVLDHFNAQIEHLHSIADRFLQAEELKIKQQAAQQPTQEG